MNTYSNCAFIAMALGLAACSDNSESNPAKPSPTASQPSQVASQPKNELKTADIPVAYIPPIVVPDFLSMYHNNGNCKSSYVGPEGRFDINGDGSCTWRKGNTTVTINKNGSATLHGERGLLTIKPDGSGTWQRRGGNAPNTSKTLAKEQVRWAALFRLR